jgi:hypothetical protein
MRCRQTAITTGAALALALVHVAPAGARVIKQTERDYRSQEVCVEQARIVSDRFLKMVRQRRSFSNGERVVHDQRPGKFIVQTFYDEGGRSLLATIVCRPGGDSITTHQTIE